MEKYYSFSWQNIGDRDNWFPVLPCRVWVGLNGTTAEVTIDTAGKLIFNWNRSRLNPMKDFTEITTSVIESLISQANSTIKKRCLNLNSGTVANAWYELGYSLQKLGDGWALFSRMD